MTQYPNLLTSPRNTNCIEHVNFTEESIMKYIKNLKSSRGSRFRWLQFKVPEDVCTAICYPLAKIMTISYASNKLPVDWKRAGVV
ncbi:hypothetical protein HHI36_002188, partial [Cryptolaemus montrouzieri]